MTTMILVETPCLAFQKPGNLPPRELIAKHLNSIGASQILADRKNCVFRGTGRTKNLTAVESRWFEGPTVFFSDGPRTVFSADFSLPNYPREQFRFDGKQVQIGFPLPGTRSQFGAFLWLYGKDVIKEGLVGGTLSTAWPLLDAEIKKAKLKIERTKKVGDRELYEVNYDMKNSGDDVTIRLYFDSTDFRHVGTVYRFRILQANEREVPEVLRRPPQPRGSGGQSPSRLGTIFSPPPNDPALLSERFIFFEENFTDFQTVNGLTVPTRWIMRLNYELPNSGPLVLWDVRFNQLEINQNLEIKDIWQP